MTDSPRLRELANGTLMAISRGTPPTAPEGYYQDFTNPYLYYPKPEECDERVTIMMAPPCGCSEKRPRLVCMRDKEPINPKKCKECKNESKKN